jgi:hypothetical protein
MISETENFCKSFSDLSNTLKQLKCQLEQISRIEILFKIKKNQSQIKGRCLIIEIFFTEL